MRGATYVANAGDKVDFQFQSTLPMRGATKALAKAMTAITISIHTPHAGSDR